MTASNSKGYATPFAIATDPVVFTLQVQGLSVLLYARPEAQWKGLWSLPGGFLGDTESAEECATRKLEEKTGLPPVHLEQLATYSDPDRDPRGWIPSIAYLALVPFDNLVEPADDAQWFPLDALPSLMLDHQLIINDALARIKGKLWDSNIAMGLLPNQFSLAQMRGVYEALLDRTLNAGNFQRRILAMDLLVETGTSKPARGRPAATYSWISRSPAWVRPVL